MKPVVGVGLAWTCTVISVFAIFSLITLGFLYQSGHEEFAGGKDDPAPEDLPAVASTIFTAAWVYLFFFAFCGCQGWLHIRNSNSAGISL